MNKRFSKKHYEALAAFFKYELELEIAIEVQKSTSMASNRADTIRGLIRLLAYNLQNDNPKFNVKKFYAACGLEE